MVPFSFQVLCSEVPEERSSGLASVASRQRQRARRSGKAPMQCFQAIRRARAQGAANGDTNQVLSSHLAVSAACSLQRATDGNANQVFYRNHSDLRPVPCARRASLRPAQGGPRFVLCNMGLTPSRRKRERERESEREREMREREITGGGKERGNVE